jgi:hypothetical protein
VLLDVERGRAGIRVLTWVAVGMRVRRGFVVVEGHEAVVGSVDDAVEAGVEAQDDDDDEPAGEEVDEEADFVAAKPAPFPSVSICVCGRGGGMKRRTGADITVAIEP